MKLSETSQMGDRCNTDYICYIVSQRSASECDYAAKTTLQNNRKHVSDKFWRADGSNAAEVKILSFAGYAQSTNIQSCSMHDGKYMGCENCAAV